MNKNKNKNSVTAFDISFIWKSLQSKGQSNSDGISDWNRSPSIWSVLRNLDFRAVWHTRHGVDVEINQYLSFKYCRMSYAIINRLSLQGKIHFSEKTEMVCSSTSTKPRENINCSFLSKHWAIFFDLLSFLRLVVL